MSRPADDLPAIRIAAALVTGADGKVLLVRKRGTQMFMQPGGKIEGDENPVDALRRELHEELGLIVSPSSPMHLGRFLAPAANEPGRMIDAELFRLPVVQDAVPRAEIEEAVWVDVDAALELNLAPFTRDHVLPLFRSMRGASQ